MQNGGLVQVGDGTNGIDVPGTNVLNLGSGTDVLPNPVSAGYVRVIANNGSTGAIQSIEVFAAPEPATLGVLGVGAAALFAKKRRK